MINYYDNIHVGLTKLASTYNARDYLQKLAGKDTEFDKAMKPSKLTKVVHSPKGVGQRERKTNQPPPQQKFNPNRRAFSTDPKIGGKSPHPQAFKTVRKLPISDDRKSPKQRVGPKGFRIDNPMSLEESLKR